MCMRYVQLMYQLDTGGVDVVVCTTRVVFVAENLLLSVNTAHAVFSTHCACNEHQL